VFYDEYYLMLVLPAFLIALWAQAKVQATFLKYSKVQTSGRFTGYDVASRLLRQNGIYDVEITATQGSLTDHFDPSKKVIALSEPVYGRSTVAAVGVAAHETGHAIQHAVGYGPLVLRSTVYPIANIGSFAGPWLAIIGLFMNMPVLFNIGIVLFSAAVVFYLITLPVELNASKRALAGLDEYGILTEEELKGAKKVLTAAAMTYVASALTAIASLMRLLLLRRRK
jgi:Zn-dependent membrane protease YugP